MSRRYVQALGSLVVVIALAVLSLWNQSDEPQPTAPMPTNADARSVPSEASRPTSPVPESDAAFDYYVLVLSWSPTYCASDAGRGGEDDQQCRSGRTYGFVLHGLWPQNERGYPRDCPSDEPRRVGDDAMARALEVSPSRALVQHEWEKHGTCSGLSQDAFFSAAIDAFRSISVPPAYTAPERPVTTTPDEVRMQFLSANPTFAAEGLSATCSRNEFAELWVCLDRRFGPRACSPEVQKRHCGGRRVRMRAVRGDWPG